jgi:hypothetical protein
MRPLWKRLAASSGIDSFQALCLSVALIKDLVDDFIAKGGRFYMDGELFTFEGYPMAALAERPFIS